MQAGEHIECCGNYPYFGERKNQDLLTKISLKTCTKTASVPLAIAVKPLKRLNRKVSSAYTHEYVCVRRTCIRTHMRTHVRIVRTHVRIFFVLTNFK